jgi:hypothetical protein
MVAACSIIQSSKLCLMIGELRPLTFSVNIESYAIIPSILLLLVFDSFLLFISLSTHLMRFFFHVFMVVFIFLFCVQKSFEHLLHLGLVAINCFSFCLSWRVFYLFLNYEWWLWWVEQSILAVTFFHNLKCIMSCPLAFHVSVEKSVVILISLTAQVTWCFSLASFNILSLFSILNVLTIIWHGNILFLSCLFGVLKASLPRRASLSEELEVLCYYIFDYASYPIRFHLSFFSIHDS